MVNHQILSYLKQHKDEHGIDALRTHLIKGGFDQKEVDEAVKQINNQANFSQPMSSHQMQSTRTGNVKKRNIFLVYFLPLITFGIYSIYWMVKTKNEMNSLGAKIPSAILIFIPIANLVWLIKYSIAFSDFVRKDGQRGLWIVLFLLFGIAMPGLVQSGLNKIATR